MGALDGDPRRPAAASVLVLGGAGFIGRHVVAALVARGRSVIVGTRHPRRRSHEHPAWVHREVHLDRLLDAAAWADALGDCSAVVNCVGILRERGHETYRRVHHQAPAALAQACAARGVRLIHVSALGLDADVRSGFLRSKRDGEAALRNSDADWHLVRPSLLDGEGGFGARWIRRVARWPVHPLPRAASGRIAVLDVRDLGEAIAHLALDDTSSPHEALVREHDLGGLQALTLAEHLAAMRAMHTSRPALRFAIPDTLARIAAHVCDLFHVTPFSYGHWELLQRDNCPRDNRLPFLLGRAPRVVGASPIMPPPLPVVATTALRPWP
ncbi:MAG: NAD(P)H-binding protein [Lysobacter sp.]|nr:NAD(P)H-binding protein [Lysobacter sp.]